METLCLSDRKWVHTVMANRASHACSSARRIFRDTALAMSRLSWRLKHELSPCGSCNMNLIDIQDSIDGLHTCDNGLARPHRSQEHV